MQPSALLLAVCWVQGMYFLLTGVLPLISIRTFEAITGPKTDKWLVQTVGVLVTVIGAVLLLAAHAQRFSFEIGLLAVGSALGLAAIDIVFVARKRIGRIYLLDAAAEVLLALGWIVGGLWSR
jgi:hypothetical protein